MKTKQYRQKKTTLMNVLCKREEEEKNTTNQ